MVMVREELAMTVTVTGGEVVVAPRLSAATAVRELEPALKLTGRSKGVEATLPRDVAPSKNWTLVMLPSVSLAVAWSVRFAGAGKEAPSIGLVIVTEGGLLGTDGVERV